jgi:CheY-like chemotaxis protein
LYSTFTNLGWTTDIEELLEVGYNFYPDGTVIGSLVTQEVDNDVEGMEFPLYAYKEPEGEQVYFNGTFRKRTSAEVSSMAVERATRASEVVYGSGLNCYLDGDSLVVSDIMMPDMTYTERVRLLSYLQEHGTNTIKPVLVNSVEELERLEAADGYDIVRNPDIMYTPGNAALHSYRIVRSVAEEDCIVIQKYKDNRSLCTNATFTNFYEITTETKLLENVKCNKSFSVTEEILGA